VTLLLLPVGLEAAGALRTLEPSRTAPPAPQAATPPHGWARRHAVHCSVPAVQILSASVDIHDMTDFTVLTRSLPLPIVW